MELQIGEGGCPHVVSRIRIQTPLSRTLVVNTSLCPPWFFYFGVIIIIMHGDLDTMQIFISML